MSLRDFVPVFIVFLLNVVIGLYPPKYLFSGEGKGVALAPLPHGSSGPAHFGLFPKPGYSRVLLLVFMNQVLTSSSISYSFCD